MTDTDNTRPSHQLGEFCPQKSTYKDRYWPYR